jgi:hypothetical protein
MRGPIFLLFIVLAILTLGARAADFSSLEERMSEGDFKAAGLNKLSPQELERLNAWLRAHGLTAAGPGGAAPAPADTVGFRAKDNTEGGPIVSKIKGKFRGWSGHSIFELANGQVWQQVDGTDFNVPAMDNPTVTIESKLLGSWLLKVEGYNHSCRVTRIH